MRLLQPCVRAVDECEIAIPEIVSEKSGRFGSSMPALVAFTRTCRLNSIKMG